MGDYPWYRIKSPESVISPALLFYPDRIRENISEMIRIAGSAERLWPHIKTHKSSDIIKLQQDAGIDKFKCSTLAEAALLGSCSVKEALLAMQPTSTHLDTFLKICRIFPETRFSTLVDNRETLAMMRKRGRSSDQKIRLWLDVNNGMNRTGIIPGLEAAQLVEDLCAEQSLDFMGLHIYDGHIRDSDPVIRAERCHREMEAVEALRGEIGSRGLQIKTIIAGGSPSFPIHAKTKEFDLSPGTTLLWDSGYGNKFPEMPFKQAAALLTRVISKPAPGVVCTDLGHKSVASEMPFPRIELLNLDNCEQTGQSEEHLVLKCSGENSVAVGKEIYALPVHICPTVSKHTRAQVVENNEVTGSWSIRAIDHGVELKNKNDV